MIKISVDMLFIWGDGFSIYSSLLEISFNLQLCPLSIFLSTSTFTNHITKDTWCNLFLLSDCFSAVRTVVKILNYGTAAMCASPSPPFLFHIDLITLFIKNGAAVITDLKGNPFFDRKKRDKKKTQIMIHSFQVERVMTAHRTDSGLFFQTDCLRLNPSDKEKHHLVFCI